jgi:hypothetical protein
VHEFVADFGYTLSSAAILVGMDYEEMRRLACGQDAVTPYHLDRLLLLNEIELQAVGRDDLPAVMDRQWYRTRNLVRGVAKFHLERSRASAVGQRWRSALEPGVLP